MRLPCTLAREAEIGAMEAMVEAADRGADFHDVFATLIGVRCDEIAFADSASRAWDIAFHAVPFLAGDRITCQCDITSFFKDGETPDQTRERVHR